MIKLSQYLSNKSVAVLIFTYALSLQRRREHDTMDSLFFVFASSYVIKKTAWSPQLGASMRFTGICGIMKALLCVWAVVRGSRCYSACLSTVMDHADAYKFTFEF